MATVTSTSTLVQVQAAYDDNASYAASNSLTMAQDFVTAARILLRRIPGESSTRDGGVKFQLELLSREIERAESWMAAGNGVVPGEPGASGATAAPFTRVSTQLFNR